MHWGTRAETSHLTQTGSSSNCVSTAQFSSSPVNSPSPFRADREIWLGERFTTNLERCFRIWLLIKPAMLSCSLIRSGQASQWRHRRGNHYYALQLSGQLRINNQPAAGLDRAGLLFVRPDWLTVSVSHLFCCSVRTLRRISSAQTNRQHAASEQPGGRRRNWELILLKSYYESY